MLSNWEIAIRLLAWSAAGLFVFKYAFVEWFKTAIGVHLMVFTFLEFCFLSLVIWVAFTGERPDYYDVVANVLFVGTFLLLAQRNYLFWKANRENRRVNPENKHLHLTITREDENEDNSR